MYPGVDYGKLYPEAAGANQQYMQGIDPQWTQLAMMYGFIPNPYPAAGTEGQDQMRFLGVLKNIADAQLGGPSGPYSQMSPNNPLASLPFGMRQYMGAMAPLFQSDQGRALMPMTNQTQFARGYQYGPLDTGTESPLMQVLRTQRQGGAVGQTPGQPVSGPANSSPGQAAQVSGDNTPGQTPPPTAEASISGGLPAAPASAVTPPTTTPQDEIRAGLEQQSTQNEIGAGPGKVAPPLQDAWNAYLESRAKGAAASQSKELDFWTNPVFRDFASWVRGALGQQKA